MDRVFEDKGYQMDASSDTLVITAPDGRVVDIEILGLADMPLDSSIESGHAYVNDHYIGPAVAHGDKDALFDNVRERAAPQVIDLGVDGRVTNGSHTSIPVIGTVQHWVDGDDYMVANVTVEDKHKLDPGVVVRWLDERDDGYHLMTLGFGNGDYGRENKMASEPFWGLNAGLIAVENIPEQNIPIWSSDNDVAVHQTAAFQLAEHFTGKASSEYAVDPHWAARVSEPTTADYFGFGERDDVPPIEGNTDAAVQWAYGELAVENEGLRLSGEIRADVGILHEAADGDTPMQGYLQHVDYRLASDEAAAGVQNVKPVIGQTPDVPSTLSDDDPLLNPAGYDAPPLRGAGVQ